MAARLHCLPFQCKIAGPPSDVLPTAHAFAAVVAATPVRKLAPGWRASAVRFQVLPFQCMISAWPKPIPPTAQALRADVALTPISSPCCTFGAATRWAVDPVRRRMSGRPLAAPTAQEPPRNLVTAVSRPCDGSAGPLTVAQLLPSQ